MYTSSSKNLCIYALWKLVRLRCRRVSEYNFVATTAVSLLQLLLLDVPHFSGM